MQTDSRTADAPPGSAPPGCSATFHIQEERGAEWTDYATKDTAEIVIARIAELKIEKPGRIFRGIVRVTTDHLLPNAKLTALPDDQNKPPTT